MAADTSKIVDIHGRPLLTRGYDAASRSRRTSAWVAGQSGPNREISLALSTLRARHRDLARNNPWARRAIQSLVTNWIGAGIRAQWKTKVRQSRWSTWFETTQCDADGRSNGYGLQGSIARAIVESGAVLVRRRPRRPEDGLAVPLQIQILEIDHLDRNKSTDLPTGGWIDQGIEFDPLGRRAAYWLFSRHPGEARMGTRQSARYAASDVLHLFRSDRPGQIDGVPWGTGAMLRLRMLDDYQDAQLERQRLAACYMGFRRVPDPSMIDGQSSLDEYTLLEKLEPGAIEDLPPGHDITFASPPQPEDDREFQMSVLRACAADYGLPYEVLTGDLSEVNFSSARMGFQEFSRNIDVWRWQLLEPQFLSPLAAWYLEAELLAGFGGRAETPLWTAPSRQIVDPAREIPAIIEAVRGGLMSLPQAIRAQGFDPIVLATEHAEFMAILDGLGVTFDSIATIPAPAPVADQQVSA